MRRLSRAEDSCRYILCMHHRAERLWIQVKPPAVGFLGPMTVPGPMTGPMTDPVTGRIPLPNPGIPILSLLFATSMDMVQATLLTDEQNRGWKIVPSKTDTYVLTNSNLTIYSTN